MKNEKSKAETTDAKILNCLASIAAGHHENFCARPDSWIRSVATWPEPVEFLRVRLEALIRQGFIRRATKTIRGKEVSGFVVSQDLVGHFRARTPNPTELHLTEFDLEFLRETHIAPSEEVPV